jgi:IS1 family transposase
MKSGLCRREQVRVRPGEPSDIGDQYVFLALAGAAKAIISYRVGKRTADNTRAFVADLRDRVLAVPEISSDAFQSYPPAIELAFGIDVHYGTIDKEYAAPQAVEAARRYSPTAVVAVKRRAIRGRPEHISTSYVERQNLTLRMQQRRFTRLTNAFSKKLENHVAAVALYVAHYNFCRVHETLRPTPAMQLGVTNHIWPIGELVDAALEGVVPAPSGRRYGRFTVIDGDRD